VLAKLMQKKVNLLLLDEPTNHLDIESREALENAILNFDGTVIAVSHDRYFINKLATRILSFQGEGKVFEFNGNYADFQAYSAEIGKTDVKENKASSSGAIAWENKKKKEQIERKRLSRIKKIQQEIEKAEQRIAQIDAEVQKIATDYVALQALFEEKEKLEETSMILLEEWENLET
jgi:ABC-type multidrug transport system ATPase subunit